jgi:FxLD family lantipeptide
MTTSAMDLNPRTHETTEPDPFDLDIRIIESGGLAATLIDLTDDGCGSTCPKACATDAG